MIIFHFHIKVIYYFTVNEVNPLFQFQRLQKMKRDNNNNEPTVKVLFTLSGVL